MRDPSLSSSESYAPLLIRATDQRRSKKLFGLRSTSARFQRKCFFPLSANLSKIRYMVFPTTVSGAMLSDDGSLLLHIHANCSLFIEITMSFLKTPHYL